MSGNEIIDNIYENNINTRSKDKNITFEDFIPFFIILLVSFIISLIVTCYIYSSDKKNNKISPNYI